MADDAAAPDGELSDSAATEETCPDTIGRVPAATTFVIDEADVE